MKKRTVLILMCIALASLLAASAVVAAPAGKDTPANDNPPNLYLYPKVSAETPEWETQWEADAWGKYNFTMDGQSIAGVFNGHGLVADTDYALISYNDPWSASPQMVVIGSDVADRHGNVHIKTGPVDLGTDVASPIYDWNGEGDGYKIWLVLSADITGARFSAWNPDAYLFENNRIGATAP